LHNKTISRDVPSARKKAVEKSCLPAKLSNFEVLFLKTPLSTGIFRHFCLETPVDKRLLPTDQLQSGKHPDGAEVPVRMLNLDSSTNPHHATKHGDYWLAEATSAAT
jgi:hypothetical protein